MISAKEAKAQTLQRKENEFSFKIVEAIDDGFFSVILDLIDWKKNWKPYIEGKLIENGYKIIEEDVYIYICWGD